MSRFLICLTVVLSACGGGAINAELTMPKPFSVTNAGGIETISGGLIVEAKDSSSVCERIRVRVYTSPTAPSQVAAVPAGVKPVAEGRGLGTYSADKPVCAVLAVSLPARDDYWVVVEYPSHSPDDPSISYLSLSAPSLKPPGSMINGFYPVKVVDKQSTKLTATMDLPKRPSWP